MPCAASWRSRRTRRQDAHVNTSAACISGAPQGRGAQACRAGASCPFAGGAPVRSANPAPSALRSDTIRTPPAPPAGPLQILLSRHRIDLMEYLLAAAAVGPPLSVRWHCMRGRRGSPRLPPRATVWLETARSGAGWPPRLAARRASVGHAVRRPSRAKCRHASCKRRIASRVSPDASVQAAAPCQNSRSSPCRFGAPSFNFLRSQELPCRHCSGLV
ncbi:hypothetical protein DM43_5920 [Burkholderia cepacia]|uniref:Uncharacterized protein n=1 Tax=Burkholderia cepacia TaxID=292 RepID=A0AA88Z804_BURCE|nr:hypothetical protein DM43_5920 [Burkholderia cepacia]